MCFLSYVLRFLSIKVHWKKYLGRKVPKSGSIEDVSYGYSPISFLKKQFISVRKIVIHPWFSLFYLKLTRPGTLEHFILTAAFGLVFGVSITFLYFYLDLYQGFASVIWSFLIRLPLLVLMTVSIAFTEKARCMLFLIPLQFFSSRGKVYIGAQVIFLVLGGPLMNIQHNLSIIQDSATCQQRGAAAAAAEIADILFGPFSSFKQAAQEIINGIKNLVEKLQKILSAFKRSVMALAEAIQDAAKWINSKINGCKNTVGGTYQFCMNAFAQTYNECKVSVPSIFVKMCSVTAIGSKLCSVVKPGEYLCDLVFFNVDTLVTSVYQRISRLLDRAYMLLYFNVDIHHEFRYDSNSKSIAEEIQERFLSTFGFLQYLSSSYVLWGLTNMFFKLYFLFAVYFYQRRYLRREDFDNYFINRRLRHRDFLETQSGKESIFPLKRMERLKYVEVTALSLVPKELKILMFPAIMFVKTIFVFMIIIMDNILYWMINQCRVLMVDMIQSFGIRTELSIEGSSFMSGLSHRVMRALNHMDSNFYSLHFTPCVPNPKPPNSRINKMIYILLGIMWTSWLLQPYARRFRHVVMDYYHPEMANNRAKWLYKSITLKRTTFISLIRINLLSKFGSEKKEVVSILDIIRVKWPFLTLIIGKGTLLEECAICNHSRQPLNHCPGNECQGIYCDDCYITISGVCSLCNEYMMLPGFEGRFKPKAVSDTPDEIDLDNADGLFLIHDDEYYENEDYYYQEEFACMKDLTQTQYVKQKIPENDNATDGEFPQTIFFTFENELADVSRGNRSGAKGLQHNEMSYRKFPFAFEDYVYMS